MITFWTLKLYPNFIGNIEHVKLELIHLQHKSSTQGLGTIAEEKDKIVQAQKAIMPSVTQSPLYMTESV